MALGYSSFVTPAGNLAPAFSGGGFTAAFDNTATFTCGAGETCAAGEYRQYVMGQFAANGSVLMHILCGATVMSPNVYQEDGCPSGACNAYGHRTCPPSPYSQYVDPDQATGAEFAMIDSPGFRNIMQGTTYQVDLSFQGKLIDTGTNAELVSRLWTVQGQATAPMGALTATAAVRLGAGDKVLAVNTGANLLSGLPEVHVVISRKPGSPPLAAGSVDLVLRDASGAAIGTGAPAVHEVGNSRRATASIVYPLAAGSGPPMAAALSFGDRTLAMPVTAL